MANRPAASRAATEPGASPTPAADVRMLAARPRLRAARSAFSLASAVSSTVTGSGGGGGGFGFFGLEKIHPWRAPL
ncbi:MAG: hypothetical protein R3D03_09030 [Geminicoccaceae bacterium]